MKAESTIFTGIQRPFTMFGIPALMLGFCAAMAAVTFGGFVAAGLMAWSIPAAVLALLSMWTVFYRQQRNDHHFGNAFFIVPRFWKKHQTRTLIAGHPSTTKQGGKS